MNITAIHLENFKRFTDLRIEGIPPDARLVLLIGANGSGKSCVFDAFEFLNSRSKNTSYIKEYYEKEENRKSKVEIQVVARENKNGRPTIISGQNAPGILKPGSFYGRTSFRQLPKLRRTSLGATTKIDSETDQDRPRLFIDKDNRFEADIDKITEIILTDFFRRNDSSEQIKGKYIDPINRAFDNIFGTGNGSRLELIEILPPLEGKVAQITFRKGSSEIHYDKLSAGEKEVVNILFNLLARRHYFQDTVYFFDEIDLHLNTKLQYNLLREIVANWIPPKGQFWTASHSLGFIQFANEYEHGCIIDFDDLDFDQPQVLAPRPKDILEVYEIAVSKEFLDKMLQDKTIVFAEDKDTILYNDLAIADTLFISATGKNDVFHKAASRGYLGLMDRDYLTDEEVAEIKSDYKYLRILPYYSIENLLFHPDNLEAYHHSRGGDFDKSAYIRELAGIKDSERDYLLVGLQNARSGYPFYKENKFDRKLKAFKGNSPAIVDILRSTEFETWYKVFPAKDYGGALRQRQNLRKTDLAKTPWFSEQIAHCLNG